MGSQRFLVVRGHDDPQITELNIIFILAEPRQILGDISNHFRLHPFNKPAIISRLAVLSIAIFLIIILKKLSACLVNSHRLQERLRYGCRKPKSDWITTLGLRTTQGPIGTSRSSPVI